ncbi:MAG TPA: potassium/proton antiporter [Myxococcota bacterium]|nr:potassium/proton antiporter [Myxococcota bacterium]
MTEPALTAAILAAVGVLLALAGLASPISQRLGVPALVIFLGLGMLAGSEGIAGIPFEDYELSFRLGTLALVLILFDGGLNTSSVVARRAALPAGLLASVAVVITAGIVALAGYWLGLPIQLALLAGAVVSSTDAAAVFSVLRGSGVRLHEHTGAVLELESGLNDPMAVFLTLAATEWALGAAHGPAHFAGELATQFLVGAAGGLGIGWLGRQLLRAVRLPATGLYPVLTVAIALLAFGLPTLANGSGFLSVYLAGIVLSAGPMPYRAGVRRVHDALAWLAQIVMFVLLGLLVFPSRLEVVVPVGIALAALLAIVARPLAVMLVLVPLRVSWREVVFVSWVGLRGAVPIILATYPVVRGVPGGEALFHLVFFVVVLSSIIPGATVAPVARWLGLGGTYKRPMAASLELVSLRELPGEFVWYQVAEASAVAGQLVRDLDLPEGCLVTLVVRGGGLVVPKGSTQLRAGDEVCVFATPEIRTLLDLLFGGSTEARE